MAPKKEKNSGEKKKRTLTIAAKKQMIEQHERGVRVMDLAKMYNRSTSTICTILKQKDAIKSANPAKGTKILSQKRTNVNDKMEKLLLLWMKDRELAGDTLTEVVICEKARSLYDDLKQKEPSTSAENGFMASHGWFDNFKKRTGFHSVARHVEAMGAEVNAEDEYIPLFDTLVASEGYIPQQVFNCDETVLFWKRMPWRTFITAEENKMPGLEDRLTLALCANASGDCKVKPLLVYQSQNPRVVETCNIVKANLTVMWRANAMACVTRQFFVDWINLTFGPAVKKYLIENKLSMKALLILDIAPAHPPGIENDILDEFKFVKVLHLPPNTTSALQPMDQQVIANFKMLYIKHLFLLYFEVTEHTNVTLRQYWKLHYNIAICSRIINLAWQEVTRKTLNAAWKKLWLTAVEEKEDFEEFESDTKNDIEVIVSLGKTMNLEVDEDGINELIKAHDEHSTEELRQLQVIQDTAIFIKSEEESEPEEEMSTLTNEINDILAMWENLSALTEKYHPDKALTGRVSALVNDTCLAHFHNILRDRQKQTTFLMCK